MAQMFGPYYRYVHVKCHKQNCVIVLFNDEGDVSVVHMTDFVAMLVPCHRVLILFSPLLSSPSKNVTYPENRGTAFALFNLSDDIGKGGGPVLVAMLVKAFGDRRCLTDWLADLRTY